jgi:hypothetical protein
MGFEATATTTAMCNSFIQKYWTMVGPIKKIRNTFVNTLNELETTLANTVFSATDQIKGALNDIENQTKASIPGDTIDAVREVKNFVDGCDCFFGTEEGAQSAVSAVLGSALGIYDQIDDYVGQFAYPELQAGTVANTLNKLLNGANIGIPGGGNITNILKEADCMVSCMSSLCPGSASEVQLIANDLQAIYDDFQLDDDPTSSNYGGIKFEDLYSRSGMTGDDILNMQITIDGIGGVQQEAARGVANSANAIKNALKGGLF